LDAAQSEVETVGEEGIRSAEGTRAEKGTRSGNKVDSGWENEGDSLTPTDVEGVLSRM